MILTREVMIRQRLKMSILPFQKDEGVQESVSDAITDTRQQLDNIDEEGDRLVIEESEAGSDEGNEEGDLGTGLEKEIQELKKRQESLRKKKVKLSKRVENLEEDIGSQENAENEFLNPEKVQKLDERQHEVNEHINKNARKLSDLESKYDELPGPDKVQELEEGCQQTADEVESILPAVEKAFEDVESLGQKSVVTAEKLCELESEIKASTPSKNSFEDLKERLDNLEKKIEQETSSADTEISESEEVEGRLLELEKGMDQLEGSIEKAETEEKIDKSSLESRLEKMEEKIETNEVSRQEFKELEDSVEDATDLLLDLAERVD